MKRMEKILLVIFLASIIVVFPSVYVVSLNDYIFKPTYRWIPSFEDNSFPISTFGDAAWSDSNFTQGWIKGWTLNQNSTSAGFVGNGTVADMYACFNGRLAAVAISKDVGPIDTTIFQYLVINCSQTSNSPALQLSIYLADGNGVWHGVGWFHTSTVPSILIVELQKVYQGTITIVDIDFSNGFDASYKGGVQHSYIYSIGFFRTPPWALSTSSKSLEGSIDNSGKVLNVTASGYIQYGTLVSAQGGSFNRVITSRYLSIWVKTYSIDVAARIVIWSTNPTPVTVLLRTYNDAQWHHEVIDLWYFGLANFNSYLIELGWQSTSKPPISYASVNYKQMAFGDFELTT